MHSWSALSELPKEVIKKVVPEYVRQKDKEACEYILDNLSEE